MKKIGKILVCCLVAVMAFFAVACGGDPTPGDEGGGEGGGSKVDKNTLYDIYDPDRPEYDFDFDSGYVRPEPPTAETRYDPDPDPAYAGAGATTKTRMEAENAIVDYNGNSTTAWKNEFSDVNNTAFDFRLSNKLATRNLNTPGTTITFKFKSDKSYTVKMQLYVSAYDEASAPYVLKDNLAVRSEGMKDGEVVYSYADTTDKKIEWADTEEKVSGGSANGEYFHFAAVELNAAIYEGDTELIIEYEGKGGGNVDYIELDTSANISGFDTAHYMDGNKAVPDEGSKWYVSKFPTDDEDGVISVRKYIDGAYRTYSYGLPKYKTDGKLTDGYTTETLSSGKVQYSFPFKTGVFSFVDDPDMTTTVTLKNYPSVKFADGSATLAKKPGEILEASDFEAIAGGRTIQQINVIDSAGILLETATPGEWKFPMEPVTLEVTCFSPENGYTWLNVGSGANSGFNTDGLADSSFTGKTSLTKNTVVKGDNFAEKGLDIKTTGEILAGSGLRFDTKYAVTAGVYEFKYNFENKGAADIHLRGYQISASSEYKNGNMALPNTERYPMAIELKAGESKSFTAQYKLGSNGNALTYFVADQNMSGMNLGMSMSAKSLGNVDLDHPYAPECVRGECDHNDDPSLRYTLTLAAGQGVTFAGGAMTAELAKGAPVPAIVDTTGKTIAGWYDVTDKSQTWTVSAFAMPKKNLEIAPYFAAANDGQTVIPASGKNTGKPDYYEKLGATDEEKATDEYKAKYVPTRFDAAYDIIAGEKGKTFSLDDTIAANEYFRLLSACGTSGTEAGIVAGTAYKFQFNFENKGDSALTFEVIQVQGGTDISAESGAVSAGEITVAPGATEKAEIDIRLQKDNGNAMTIILMKADAVNMKLGISMSKVNNIVLDPTAKYTLTLDAPDGVTFAGGATTAELAEGETLPAVEGVPAGKEIAGWYNADQQWTADSFVMPAADTSVTPHFIAAGHKRLWFGTAKAGGKPDSFATGSTITAADFTALAGSTAGWGTTLDSAKTMVKGTGGYAEEGVLFECTKDMAVGDAFRNNTVVNGGEDAFKLEKDKTYAYSFNFENKGTGKISLNIFMVNNGVDKTSTGGDNHFTLTLEAGACTTVTVSPSYLKFYSGSTNDNACMYFEVAEAMAGGMKLAMSMSINPVPVTA